MALEALIQQLITSLDANTAAMKGGTAPKATATATTAKATTTKAPAGPTFDEVKAVAGKVMEQKSRPFAKKIISDVGGAKELATVKPEKYPALLKALNAALVEEEAAEEEAEEDTEL